MLDAMGAQRDESNECPTCGCMPGDSYRMVRREIHNPFMGTAMPNCGRTIGSIGTNEHPLNSEVFVFPIDPIAPRRFATPVELAEAITSEAAPFNLRDSVALWLNRSLRHLR